MGTLTVLYENHRHPKRRELEAAHGFSAFIEMPGFNLLFDTGWDGHMLIRNARRLGIDISDVDAIFISHGHWDHMGGLVPVLEASSPRIIYIPSDYSKAQPKEFARYAPGITVRRVGDRTALKEVSPQLWSTGTWKGEGPIGEQGLLVPTSAESTFLLVVGCLHPSLPPLLSLLPETDTVVALLGGLHGFQDVNYLASSPISHVYAGHCTKHSSLLASQKAFDFHPLYVGYTLDF